MINFLYPSTMAIVKIETQESFLPESLDVCCEAFADGDVTMRDACTITPQIVNEEFIWDGL